MGAPDGLFFSNNHEWIKFLDDGRNRAVIGITDFAQQSLGDILFINLCAEGDSFSSGDAIGDIESIKSVSDIICPIDGTVARINEKVLETPDLINRDPYNSWLVEMNSITDLSGLISETEYEIFISN